MTPAEQNLIEELFDRIRNAGVPTRDAEADALIGRLMRQTPDAAYALVQAVLVQDQVLREAHQRIRMLQDRQPAANPGGSFLGTAERQRWGASPTGPSVPLSQAQPQPAYGTPPQPAYAAQAPERGETGGFMRGALQTAAGVAGGALLFEGIRDLLHGGTGGLGGLGGAAGGPWSNPETVVNETTVNETVNDYGDDTADQQTADNSDQDDRTDDDDWSDDSDGFGGSDNSV